MDYICHHNVIDIFGEIPENNVKENGKAIDLILRIEDNKGFILKEIRIL